MLRDSKGTVREQGLREGTRGKEGGKDGRRERREEKKVQQNLRKAKEGGWRVAFWNVNNGGVCEAG